MIWVWKQGLAVIVKIVFLDQDVAGRFGAAILGIRENSIAAKADFATTNRQVPRHFDINAAPERTVRARDPVLVRKGYASVRRIERISDVEIFNRDPGRGIDTIKVFCFSWGHQN